MVSGDDISGENLDSLRSPIPTVLDNSERN
jgi:hypothetical protein